jgi:hypothetical protein
MDFIGKKGKAWYHGQITRQSAGSTVQDQSNQLSQDEFLRCKRWKTLWEPG